MEGIGGMVGVLVTALSVIGGGIAFLIRRRDAQKDPIPKESAAVALSKDAVAIMAGVADELREDGANLRRELGTVRAELAGVRRDQMATQQTLSMLQASLAAAARHIEAMYRWARDGATPPPPLIPDALRDLIDPSLHD